MEISDIYLACRARLLRLAPTVTPAREDATLAATPPWTVADGYRHLTGVCSDMLDGVLDGAGSPPWTAAQLATRAGWPIDKVCAEWSERGPELDARVAAAGRGMVFVAFDAWTHEQDIRAALGLSGLRDAETVSTLASLAVDTFGARYAASGAPPVELVIDGVARRLGAGEGDGGRGAEVVLRTTSYELMRIIFGRRSRAQVAAGDWSGDHTGVIDALHLFDFPEHDITD